MRVMSKQNNKNSQSRLCTVGSSRSFTLIELLVVMGIIIILISITVISVAAIAKDANLKSSINKVKGALSSARAMAIQTSKPTGIVFRVRWKNDGIKQVTEIVTIQYNGEALPGFDIAGFDVVVNRFTTAKNIGHTLLSEGIKVAGPFYAGSEYGDFGDETWITQPQFPNTYPDYNGGDPETPGRLIGVMFDSDGSLITSIPQTDASVRFLDFDDELDPDNFYYRLQNVGNTTDSTDNYPQQYYDENIIDEAFPDMLDEPNIYWVPFLAVYSDEEAREFYGDQDWNWNNPQERYFEELTNGVFDNNNSPNLGYIAEFGTRIHFNRYTGVAIK